MFYKSIFIIVALNNLLCHALSEGDPCTWGEFNGTCVDVNYCYSNINDENDNEHPPICNFRGDVPIVCCTEYPEENVTDTSTALYDENYEGVRKTGPKLGDVRLENIHRAPNFTKQYQIGNYDKILKELRKCYGMFQDLPIQPIIIGGEDTPKGEYPFMALLGYGDTLDSAEWSCGGTLISERFILTAAHCISSPRIGPVMYIALGVWKRSDDMALWQTHNVKNIIPHPDYQSPSKYNDIALLETEDKVEFTMGIYPACLLTDRDITYDTVFALGWGALGPGERQADILQKVTLQTFTDEECASMYHDHRLLKDGFNSTTQICCGDHDVPRDTCEGDSGGPLVYNSGPPLFCDFIIGVTSYGFQCGNQGAGIYTKLIYYLPWIENIVWPN